MKRKKKTGKVLMAALGGVGAVAMSASPASAGHQYGWGADDWHMEYWFDANGTNTYNGMIWGKNNLHNTNLDMFETFSWTDIRVTRAPMAAAGTMTCTQFWGDLPECDLEYVQYAEWAETLFTTPEWKWLGCHEMGHTGGIGERFDEGSCMRWKRPQPVLTQHTALDQHDKDAINFQIGPP